MEKLGFSNQWLTSVSALYNSATSRVLVVGDLGQAFSISRSVRQGCSLAPFLYLMIGEAFSSFLMSNVENIRGLQWPWLEEQILDCQFVDDIALYVQGSHNNLSRVQSVEYECIMAVFTLSLWTAQVWAIFVNSVKGSFPKIVTI